MSKLYLGSINLSDINKDDIKSWTSKDGSKSGKSIDVAIWVNPDATEDWKQLSIKAGKKDESYYIGNAKEYVANQQQSNTQTQNKQTDSEDDLPF